MASLEVTLPPNTQNILGLIRIEAPLERVFEAYSNEELFAQWWARGNPMKVHCFECREGGRWHVEEQSEEGEFAFSGCFHEVAVNRRIVQTFEYLGMPERGDVMLEKVEFFAVGDHQTEVRSHSTTLTEEARDAMVAHGMEEGWQQSVQALGRLLEGNA